MSSHVTFEDVPMFDDIPHTYRAGPTRPRKSIGNSECPRCKRHVPHERGPRGEPRWRVHDLRVGNGTPITCPKSGETV